MYMHFPSFYSSAIWARTNGETKGIETPERSFSLHSYLSATIVIYFISHYYKKFCTNYCLSTS